MVTVRLSLTGKGPLPLDQFGLPPAEQAAWRAAARPLILELRHLPAELAAWLAPRVADLGGRCAAGGAGALVLLPPDRAAGLVSLLAEGGYRSLAAEVNRLLAWGADDPPPAPETFGPAALAWGTRTYVMGVLNITPDSFSDGGRYLDPGRAVERAWQMVAEGADLLDLGAESASIAAGKPDLDQELRRLVPVVSRLARELPVPLSIDTYKSAVARACLEAGAAIINDITGLHEDPDLPDVIARHGAGVVVMHLQGAARQVSREPAYGDAVEEVADYLAEGARRARTAGIPPGRIILDPGIGVGKRTAHNLALLQGLPALRGLGYPVLLGASRTSVIGNVLEAPIGARLEGTLATTAVAAAMGVDMVRVHDVAANVRAARMADAMVRGIAPPAGGWPFDAVTGHQRRPLQPVGGPSPN